MHQGSCGVGSIDQMSVLEYVRYAVRLGRTCGSMGRVKKGMWGVMGYISVMHVK